MSIIAFALFFHLAEPLLVHHTSDPTATSAGAPVAAADTGTRSHPHESVLLAHESGPRTATLRAADRRADIPKPSNQHHVRSAARAAKGHAAHLISFGFPASRATISPLITAKETARPRRGVRKNRITVRSGGYLVAEPRSLDPAQPVVVTNEHLRITVPGPAAAHLAPAIVEVRRPEGWQTATSTIYGDWLYYGSSGVAPPTQIEVVSLTRDFAIVRWSFWNHTIPPRGQQPLIDYPFERTIYLRAGESGYFSQIRPLSIPPERFTTEHEIGWGGIWGPARIATYRELIRTENVRSTLCLNLNKDADAVVFDAERDDLRRIIVPVPGAEFIVPYFGPEQWGSVYVHEVGKSQTYGAYLYVSPRDVALPVREVCELAWEFGPAVGVWKQVDLSTCGRDW